MRGNALGYRSVVGTVEFGSFRSKVMLGVCAAAALPLVLAPMSSAQPSTAQPSTAAPSAPELDDKPAASVPMPVPQGAIGYIATRSATRWLADRKPDAVIENLPVPASMSKANGAMAQTLGRELDTAVETPGACLQIIVNPTAEDGGLFNYGFFAVEKQYCPE